MMQAGIQHLVRPPLLLPLPLQADAVPQLVQVLAAQQEQLQQQKPGGQQEEIVVNLLQTIANLATEHPLCRTQLQQAGARELLLALQEGTQSDAIRKAAETAARMASFVTWPGVCVKP
jgi:hypothetical protein